MDFHTLSEYDLGYNSGKYPGGVFLNSYEGIIRRGYMVEIKRTLSHCGFVSLGLIVWMFSFKESSSYSRFVFIMFVLIIKDSLEGDCILCLDIGRYWGRKLMSNLFNDDGSRKDIRENNLNYMSRLREAGECCAEKRKGKIMHYIRDDIIRISKEVQRDY